MQYNVQIPECTCDQGGIQAASEELQGLEGLSVTEAFDGASVLITGATGYIGSLVRFSKCICCRQAPQLNQLRSYCWTSSGMAQDALVNLQRRVSMLSMMQIALCQILLQSGMAGGTELPFCVSVRLTDQLFAVMHLVRGPAACLG